MSLYTYNSNTIYSTIVVQDDFVLGICLDSTNTTTITTFTTTHCCSSGGSRSAAAGESRSGRGGGATEDGIGWAGGSNGGEAAHKTASVRQALTGSETWQRLADGYRSARRGRSVDVADLLAMTAVFPGVSSERRQKSPRLPEGKAWSLSAESIEWKSLLQLSVYNPLL